MPKKSRRTLLLAVGAVLATAVMVPVAVNSAAADDTSASGPEQAAEPRIVGGGKASVSQHPYAVYLADRGGNQYCGAVIVSSTTVVTAAHCAVAVKRADIRVVAGRDNKRSRDGVELRVSRIWVSPDYSGDPGKGDDIAVLTVGGQLPYRPAKVADNGDAGLYEEGTKATVLGWGRVSEGGARSDYLRSAVVPVVSDKTCRTAYSGYDPSDMVCAGYPEGGIDACQGDSGGPLMVGDTLIGIVSFGEGCAKAGKPGVYTRVSHFANDISQQKNRGLIG
ncbi:S1 family peptidase [Amycolatopsis roodepoortensis]|uniref:Secreted trypsin-like serine protease n=1 Tax=Amycolatopsis roodepoortensis TaxID=700274 RepID=A0ABR9KXM3_9PSEU|nr:serine protease [Amycolatopsis roodepoortensis]MBE1573112.1 secreted trypsin-like serine protease [Amycolatopsis roodepoortensis]